MSLFEKFIDPERISKLPKKTVPDEFFNSDIINNFINSRRIKSTELVYNIARVEGENARGFDFVDKYSGKRWYLTAASSLFSEKEVRQNFGKHSILKLVEQQGIFGVYKVPVGSMLLVKTLESPSFHDNYTENLKQRSLEMMQRLYELDSNRFGINIENIAIDHDGFNAGADETYLTIIPPLKAIG